MEQRHSLIAVSSFNTPRRERKYEKGPVKPGKMLILQWTTEGDTVTLTLEAIGCGFIIRPCTRISSDRRLDEQNGVHHFVVFRRS